MCGAATMHKAGLLAAMPMAVAWSATMAVVYIFIPRPPPPKVVPSFAALVTLPPPLPPVMLLTDMDIFCVFVRFQMTVDQKYFYTHEVIIQKLVSCQINTKGKRKCKM